MVERIANLFVYIDGDTILELGAEFHEADGTDADKAAFLKSRVDSDYRTCRRFRLVEAVARREYEMMARVGARFELFETLFKPPEWEEPPFNLITSIIDNVPAVRPPGEPSSPGTMVDYLVKYTKDGKFNPGQLIDDDLFAPIKLLVRTEHYVSASKLLMSAIDTIAFIDSGEVPNPFVLWLDKYVDLPAVGLTAQELWAYRNGLLHMSNLAPRAVLKGEVPRLIMYIGPPHAFMAGSKEEKYFNLLRLIKEISDGIERWVATYQGNPNKFLEFVDRYDLTISDARLARDEMAEIIKEKLASGGES